MMLYSIVRENYSAIRSFASANRNYIKSDLTAVVASYVAAGSANFMLSDYSDEWTVAGTFVAKTATFFFTKSRFHKGKSMRILRSTGFSSGLKSALLLGGNYSADKLSDLPDYAAWLIPYATAGIFISGVRWYMDHKSGLISSKGKGIEGKLEE